MPDIRTCRVCSQEHRVLPWQSAVLRALHGEGGHTPRPCHQARVSSPPQETSSSLPWTRTTGSSPSARPSHQTSIRNGSPRAAGQAGAHPVVWGSYRTPRLQGEGQPRTPQEGGRRSSPPHVSPADSKAQSSWFWHFPRQALQTWPIQRQPRPQQQPAVCPGAHPAGQQGGVGSKALLTSPQPHPSKDHLSPPAQVLRLRLQQGGSRPPQVALRTLAHLQGSECPRGSPELGQSLPLLPAAGPAVTRGLASPTLWLVL